MERTKKLGKTDKRGRFIRIAEKRVNRILDDLDVLSKCANKRNYQYDDDDVRKIFNEIDKKIKDIRMMFKDSELKGNRFTL